MSDSRSFDRRHDRRLWPLVAIVMAHAALGGLISRSMQRPRDEAPPPAGPSMVWLSVPAAEAARDRPRREPGATYRATSVNPPALTTSRRSTITSPPSALPTPVPETAGFGDAVHAAGAATAAPPATPPAPSPAPLSLALPRGLTPPTPPRPAQLALRDPRANAVKLTPEERLAIAAGTIDCVIEERQPHGSVVRGPGRLVSVMAIGTAGMRGETVQMCVR